MVKNIDTIFIGDSLTSGYGVPKNNCWVSKIIDYFNFNGLNKGINGDTTASMLSRFEQHVIEYNPKLVFIMGGSNDLMLRRSINYIAGNIELMIKDAAKNNIKIIIGIPPFIVGSMAYNLFSPLSNYSLIETELIELKNTIINLCNNLHINYIDFYSATENKPNLYLDGIHLNIDGHYLLFQKAIAAFTAYT